MLWNYILFYKHTILWICDQIKYVILYKKRHVCVFSHPLVLWSSSEWRVQGCVLAVWPTPSFSPLCLRLILHGCVSCSDSRFSDARFLGDWNSAPSPSTSSPLFPWERGSSLAGLLHSLPPVVSLSPVWACWAPWRYRLALTELLGRAGGALVAGVLLRPLTCEPPAPLGPPSLLSLLSFLHPHHSGSGGSALQPHGRPNSLPLDRRALG